ncbi:MAG: IS1595 family transposase [Acidimicrobiia bacterium]|nr:IS1595 family transposase [Acidimicrobiia bacterium]
MTVIEVADRVRTEADAYAFLEQLRWGDSVPACPHCASADTVLITPKNGHSRKTRTGTMSERRVWRCRSCRRQFSVLTGTIFHGTKVSIRKWVLVIFEMCASKNGVSAREIERKYGVCPRTAWFMMHRIRAAMEGSDDLLQGVIMADETYFGGSEKFMHASRKAGRPRSRWQDPGVHAH